MSELTPKRAGYCSVCDTAILEVVQIWTDGPRKGMPRQFGPPLPGAKRAHVALLDGSHSAVSLCARCHLTPKTMPLVWKRLQMATRLESSPEWRKAREMRPYTPEQLHAALKNLERFMQNLPVGVICTETYAEI